MTKPYYPPVDIAKALADLKTGNSVLIAPGLRTADAMMERLSVLAYEMDIPVDIVLALIVVKGEVPEEMIRVTRKPD